MNNLIKPILMVAFVVLLSGCGQIAPGAGTQLPGSGDGVKLTINREAMTRSTGVSAMAIDPRDYTGQRWLLVIVTAEGSSLYVESPVRELKTSESLIPVTINLPARSDYVITALEFVRHDCGEKCTITNEIIGFGSVANVSIQNGETKVVNAAISPVLYDYEYPTEVESATNFSGSITVMTEDKIELDYAYISCSNDSGLLSGVHTTSVDSLKFGGKWLTALTLSGNVSLVSEDKVCVAPQIRVRLSNINNHAWEYGPNQLNGGMIEFRIVAPGIALQHDALPSITVRKSTGGITF